MAKKELLSKKEVKERIYSYMDKAKEVFVKDKALANKYVQKARRVGMKYKMKLPREVKRSFCKHCYSLLVPGKNLRVRTREGYVVYYCLECKKFMKFRYDTKNK